VISLGRLLRTARHLRPSQVGWRLLHVARLRLNEVRPARPTWPDGQARFAVTLPGMAASARQRRTADLWSAGRVEHLAIEGDRGDWAGAGRPRLWRYEGQYHSELVALAAVGRVEEAEGLVASWLAACPQPRGDAWEPYPVARRILNWSLAGALEPRLAPRLAPGIAAQVRFLEGHLEHHLLGNHLICDAAALVTGAAAIDSSGIEQQGRAGMSLLARELERQVLPDGGYAERTAQYHAIVLRDVLLAISFCRARGVQLDPRVERAARSMARWLAAVTRNDGVPYLNDAAPDATPPVSEVLALAATLGFGPEATEPRTDLELPQTGWSFAREVAHELLFEHGPIGPDEQPGHGHSDALSYELFWDGHPVVTDTGVTTYDVGPVREFERSAAAHATVTVGGAGADELWAAFRVGARGRVSGGAVSRTPEGARVFEGRNLAPAGWEHRRRIIYWPGEALVILDEVRGGRGPVQSHLPLDPGCSVEGETIRFGGGTLRLQTLQGGRDQGKPSWVGQGFGRRQVRCTIGFAADASGRVAYALLAPGRSASIEGTSCSIRGPRGIVQVGAPA
jgi:hypothetical protein